MGPLLRLAVALSSLWALVAWSHGASAQAQGGEAPRVPALGVTGPIDPALLSELGAGWSALDFAWPRFYPADISGWNPLTGELPPRHFVPDPVLLAAVESESAVGREVVAVLRETPPWASADGYPAAVPFGLDLPVDDPGNLWASFVTEVVRAFAPLGVRHWVIYETPDVGLGEGPAHFVGSVVQYAQMLRVTALAARAVDADAVIHVGALVGWVDQAAGREPYLARLLEVLRADPEAPGNGYYFDVVTVRALDATALIWEQLDRARGILESAGLRDKAIWLEANAASTSEPLGNASGAALQITPQQQADYIVQALVAGVAAGAQRVAIHRGLEADGPAPWGFVRSDGTRRPAFVAARATMALLGDAQQIEVHRHPAADLVLFETSTETIAVLWARGALPVTLTITAPELGEVARLRATGGSLPSLNADDGGWPAAYEIAGPAALVDAHGFLTVAGSPRIVEMPRRDDFYRVVYLTVGRDQVRLR